MVKSAILEVLDFKYKQHFTYTVKTCVQLPKNTYIKDIFEVSSERFFECLNWSNKVPTNNNNNINNCIFLRWNTTSTFNTLLCTWTRI